MASLRVAYVDRPAGNDPFTGKPLPSALAGSGISGVLLWAGIGAVQVVFFTVTMLHARATHNPRLTGLHAARRRLRVLGRRRTRLDRERIAAGHECDLAAELDARTTELWEQAREARTALGEQRIAVHRWTLARALGDPDATAALEARSARRRAADEASRATPNTGSRVTGLPESTTRSGAQKPHEDAA
jgi:hypothetical protein